MLVAYRPSSRARLAWAAVTSGGRSPPASSACSSYGISSSAKARARAWRSRSSLDRPYIRTPQHSLPARLTERSVYVSIEAMPMVSAELPDTADAVVVGGGTIGAWCAYFLRQAGLERVVVGEKGTLGSGGSSRAAGGGPVGAGCASARRQAGLERGVVVEKATLRSGASSRAAGVVRMQGGTPA